MGNGKNSQDKILSASEDNSFSRMVIDKMALNGWVPIAMD
jgi:hypothetical protein